MFHNTLVVDSRSESQENQAKQQNARRSAGWGIYFVVLPVVWLGVLGPEELGKDLALVLGPTFAPLFGSFGKAAAIWFIILNMFHGPMQPLAGAARTLSQLSEDGLFPRFLAWRSRTDCPWAATFLTAVMAVIFSRAMRAKSTPFILPGMTTSVKRRPNGVSWAECHQNAACVDASCCQRSSP